MSSLWKNSSYEVAQQFCNALLFPTSSSYGIFISPDQDGAVDAAFQLTDAAALSARDTRLITRTALEGGIAKDASLRTTESIPVGTVFAGRIFSRVKERSVEGFAWQLALLSISAVGANRTRGCGACLVEIERDKQNGDGLAPGALLKALDQRLKDESWQHDDSVASAPVRTVAGSSDRAVVLRLTFNAQTPICCPEIADKTNVIGSGFTIPASAIQGAILSRLDSENPQLASECFASQHFRAWPLLPCRYQDEKREEFAPSKLVGALRVSLTHRAAKYSVGKEYSADDFQDEAIEPYVWRDLPHGAPLKGADGVLLQYDNANETPVHLWRGKDMPHSVSSHGVLNDPETEGGRNLFTVDAMAPLCWQGIVVMPENAANLLRESLEADPVVAVGKSRTVRGLGELRVQTINGVPSEWRTPSQQSSTVLVVQSPLCLPPAPAEDQQSAEEEFRELIAAWAAKTGLSLPPIDRAWANVGVRFGWNRTVTEGRLDARRVLLPGSVIAFTQRIDDQQLASALQAGIGPERERGFGAASVHPGKAVGLYGRDTEPATLAGKPDFKQAVESVLEMQQTARGHLPSASQIRAVQQRLEKRGRKAARDFFEDQLRRASRIWFAWEPIREPMKELLSEKYDDQAASRALVVLANLAIVEGGEK